MKLTNAAFEAIYQACEPEERRKYFREVQMAQPTGAVVFAEPPAPKLERMMTGEWRNRVKLVAVADDYWSVL
jgi:hypothetical protein